MKQIPLTQGQITVVDDEDFDWLSRTGWFASRHKTQSFYAVRNVGKSPNQRPLRMQNEIWVHYNGPVPEGFTVDHADRNTLDNRVSNLRLATLSQQAQNKRLLSSANTSGYKGVSRHTQSGKWWARIRVGGKEISLGLYADLIEAARAYDEAARIHFDPAFAQLNFPQ